MGKHINDLTNINSIENDDKILIDRDGKGYSANLIDILSPYSVDGKYYTKEEVDKFLENLISLEDAKQMIKNATSRIDGGVISTTNASPSVDGIGGITENNEIIINEDMLSAGTYTLKYLDGNDNVVDNSKPITEFTI